MVCREGNSGRQRVEGAWKLLHWLEPLLYLEQAGGAPKCAVRCICFIMVQDAAYYESLRADREKAEAAERERREAEQAAAAAAAAAEAEERRQREETER